MVSQASSGLLVADFLDTFLETERDERNCALNVDEEVTKWSGTSQVIEYSYYDVHLVSIIRLTIHSCTG